MAQPRTDHTSEGPTFTDRLTKWAEDNEPRVTEVLGIREYATDNMEKDLREDVNRCIGSVRENQYTS